MMRPAPLHICGAGACGGAQPTTRSLSTLVGPGEATKVRKTGIFFISLSFFEVFYGKLIHECVFSSYRRWFDVYIG
jgi:hypothetical protein